jgi:3-dehydroquinate synthase
MVIKTITINAPKGSTAYDINIGDSVLSTAGEWVRQSIGLDAKRVAIISNSKVFGHYGDKVANSLKDAGLQVSVWKMKDGERYKNARSLDTALRFLGESRVNRSDALLALGGGVVGDLAGFAASIYLRGVPFFQVPTTLLSMIDSSVGGKTGINTEFGKNLIGTFYQPRGVLVDIETLSTLPDRELTAGFCEAVKQGALSGSKLFTQTADFLANHRTKNFIERLSDPKVRPEMIDLIHNQIKFKAQIVRQDETESLGRRDAKSRKILNFGHTFGHALERITNYRYLRHGEAVGYGIIFAGELSKILELIDENELKCLNDVVHRAGRLPSLQGIDRDAVFDAFQFDKKLISESLQWILLRGIGNPVILSGKQVPTSAVRKALRKSFN